MENQWLTKLMNKMSRCLSSLNRFLRNFNWNRIFKEPLHSVRQWNIFVVKDSLRNASRKNLKLLPRKKGQWIQKNQNQEKVSEEGQK